MSVSFAIQYFGLPACQAIGQEAHFLQGSIATGLSPWQLIIKFQRDFSPKRLIKKAPSRGSLLSIVKLIAAIVKQFLSFRISFEISLRGLRCPKTSSCL